MNLKYPYMILLTLIYILLLIHFMILLFNSLDLLYTHYYTLLSMKLMLLIINNLKVLLISHLQSFLFSIIISNVRYPFISSSYLLYYHSFLKHLVNLIMVNLYLDILLIINHYLLMSQLNHLIHRIYSH
jgi:hypothetical protein